MTTRKGVAILAISAFALACEKHDDTTGANSTDNSTTVAMTSDSMAPPPPKGPLVCSYATGESSPATSIGPAGGAIVLRMSGHILLIPPDAYPNPTDVTFRFSPGPTGTLRFKIESATAPTGTAPLSIVAQTETCQHNKKYDARLYAEKEADHSAVPGHYAGGQPKPYVALAVVLDVMPTMISIADSGWIIIGD